MGLAPGPHLAGAAHVMPVLRTMLRLAATLAEQWKGATELLWSPAGTLVRADLFIAAIDAWLGGGAFPAPILVGSLLRADGQVTSDGLTFFTGQELALSPALSADPTAARRLINRLVDRLLELPSLAEPTRLVLEDGRGLRLFPAGTLIEVSPD